MDNNMWKSEIYESLILSMRVICLDRSQYWSHFWLALLDYIEIHRLLKRGMRLSNSLAESFMLTEVALLFIALYALGIKSRHRWIWSHSARGRPAVKINSSCSSVTGYILPYNQRTFMDKKHNTLCPCMFLRYAFLSWIFSNCYKCINYIKNVIMKCSLYWERVFSQIPTEGKWSQERGRRQKKVIF